MTSSKPEKIKQPIELFFRGFIDTYIVETRESEIVELDYKPLVLL